MPLQVDLSTVPTIDTRHLPHADLVDLIAAARLVIGSAAGRTIEADRSFLARLEAILERSRCPECGGKGRTRADDYLRARCAACRATGVG